MTFKLRGSTLKAGLACAALCAAQAWAAPAMPGDGASATLSDSKATAETQAAYAFLKGRTLQDASNMLEGEHLGGPADILGATDAFEMRTYRIASSTAGRYAYPRLVGARYDGHDLTFQHYLLDPALIQQINQKLIDVSSVYHPVVALTAVPRNPWNQEQGRSASASDGSLADLDISKRGVAGSPAAKFWADVDTIATGIAALKTSDGKAIPVVFRPFAEFNTGEKYYYPNQYKTQTPEDFRKMWRQVADYYVNTKGLHNLIFCWEAWVWHRKPAQGELAPWYPEETNSPATSGVNPYVDIVAGAFYFQQRDLGYFHLDFSSDTSGQDQVTFYNLMNVAIAHNKPLGAAQWAVNYKYGTDANGQCLKGDHKNALAFMTSVDARHYSYPPDGHRTQHMAFAYYWGDKSGCMEVQNQDNATAFVDDPRVASITGVEFVSNEGGWIREAGADTGKGGAIWAGLPLRTGDGLGPNGCTNCQYRSIVSFDTSAATLPSSAVLSTAPATLLLTKSGSAGTSPFTEGLGPLWIDAAAGWFGASPAFSFDDFKTTARDLVHVATMSDPGTGTHSFGALPTQYLNRQGHTQLRLSFQTATDHNGLDNYIDWNNGTAEKPELIFSYTLPNR